MRVYNEATSCIIVFDWWHSEHACGTFSIIWYGKDESRLPLVCKLISASPLWKCSCGVVIGVDRIRSGLEEWRTESTNDGGLGNGTTLIRRHALTCGPSTLDCLRTTCVEHAWKRCLFDAVMFTVILICSMGVLVSCRDLRVRLCSCRPWPAMKVFSDVLGELYIAD